MRRFVLMTMFMVVIGAAINVLTAWGCAWWWQGSQGKMRMPGTPVIGPGNAEEYEWFKARGWKLEQDRDGMIEESTARGYARTALVELGLDAKGRPTGAVGWAAVRKRMGWPMLSMECEEWPTRKEQQGRMMYFETRWGWRVDGGSSSAGRSVTNEVVMPIKPMWSGFAVNTLLNGGALWVLCVMPGAVRRMQRKRRGCCLKCGYDLREAVGSVCPECGRKR